jgi:SPP1 gp7 family putative phage head morphogenesis protein
VIKLRPIRPNAGLEALYRRRLRALLERMHRSVMRWVPATWRADPPATLAADAAAADLRGTMRDLRRQWEGQFDDMALRLADYFAKDAEARSTGQLKRILEKGGISVRFRMTAGMRDALQATIAEQVRLIKSIPARYLDDVEGAVMRSVQAGRDLGTLTQEIEQAYGVGRRRAALIARDQNNKSTSAMAARRQLDIGIEDGIWRHSHAGKTPRPTHVRMDGRRFKIADGMYDSAEGRYVHPGELVNCRCGWSPVLPA